MNDAIQTPVLPPATLGILGGGQLGRFFVRAAQELGYAVWVLDPDRNSPAGVIAQRHLVAAYEDRAALDALAAQCAAITTEFENVPAATLAHLAQTRRVFPQAAAVAVCQDRIAERLFLRRHDFPQGAFAVIESATDLEHADAALFPAVLKAARLGYDGKGQARVANRSQAVQAWQAMGAVPCVLEQALALEAEISVVLARAEDGLVRAFPVAQNEHRDGILDVSVAPAQLPPALCEQALALARRLADALEYVGVMAVEFFVVEGALRVNEIAPRPHNSGHYSLDACSACQFEQQVRALTGLPLAEVRQHSAAVMVNLLGQAWREGEPDWGGLLALDGVHLHLYGKRTPRNGRKMGHFTLTGAALAPLLQSLPQARTAAHCLPLAEAAGGAP